MLHDLQLISINKKNTADKMKLNKNNEVLSFLYIRYGFRLGVILSGRREVAGCHGFTIIGRIRCNVSVGFSANISETKAEPR